MCEMIFFLWCLQIIFLELPGAIQKTEEINMGTLEKSKTAQASNASRNWWSLRADSLWTEWHDMKRHGPRIFGSSC